MGPFEEGEAIESISFMKESDKYTLHQILWDNEDHLSNAIIAMRLVVFQILILEWKLYQHVFLFLIPSSAVSFYDKDWYQPVQKLETILAQLGSPYQNIRKVSMGIR